MRLGASEFHVTENLDKIENFAPIDHLMVTTSMQRSWPLDMSIMESVGTIYWLKICEDDLKAPYTWFPTRGSHLVD